MANQLAVVPETRIPWSDKIETEYGDLSVSRETWRSLVDATYPNAKNLGSILLVLAACKARNLDPFKRPFHIVPMYDKKRGGMVDTIWPSIAEVRTTATRTGVYAGCDETEFGDDVTYSFKGRIDQWTDGNKSKVDVTKEVTVPEWARITVYKIVGGQRCAFVGPKVLWKETYAKMGKTDVPNDMWEKRSIGQLEKCAEAAALRKAFPEEIGSDITAEEMSGQAIMTDDVVVLHAEDVPDEESKQIETDEPPDPDVGSQEETAISEVEEKAPETENSSQRDEGGASHSEEDIPDDGQDAGKDAARKTPDSNQEIAEEAPLDPNDWIVKWNDALAECGGTADALKEVWAECKADAKDLDIFPGDVGAVEGTFHKLMAKAEKADG